MTVPDMWKKYVLFREVLLQFYRSDEKGSSSKIIVIPMINVSVRKPAGIKIDAS